MSAVLRSGARRLLAAAGQNQLIKNATAAAASPAAALQVAHISGQASRGGQPRQRPAPYDYVNKDYTFWNALFDKTTHRFDDNSKIIVVEGPPAAGKSKFAQELAKDLDMLYVPEANMDLIYINPYGYDMRKLDPQLPEKCRSYDVKDFLRSPQHRQAANFQIRMYMLRYEQYVDALAHLLSTGQGVVLDRSCFSDFVFAEAMVRSKYMSAGAKSVYYDLKKNTIDELFKPHLVVYLDVPVETVKERVAARKVDGEAAALSDAYLHDIDHFYKQEYLKEISLSSELLVYDWSNGGETEIVVEDIERIDFDRFDKHDKKLKDWRLPKEWDWCEARQRFTNDKPVLMNYFNVPRYDVPELLRSAEDSKAFRDVWYNAPGMQYAYGYNTDQGDEGVLLKTKLTLRRNI